MIVKTHEEDCQHCDRMGVEAWNTATRHGEDHWTSQTVVDDTTHTALYMAEGADR